MTTVAAVRSMVPRRETSSAFAELRPRSDVLYVYLSGSIRKGAGDTRPRGTFWADDEEQELIDGITVAAEVRTLNPAKSRLRRNDYYANFGCDLHLVGISDVMIVDARTEKGIGVGAEMMFARMHGVPVVTICPQNSNYRRDLVPDVFGEDLTDWIHPFVFGLSDIIVDDVASAIVVVNDLGPDGLRRLGTPPIGDAVEYYNRVRETFER